MTCYVLRSLCATSFILHETSTAVEDLRFVAVKKGCQAIPRSANLSQLARHLDSATMNQQSIRLVATNQMVI